MLVFFLSLASSFCVCLQLAHWCPPFSSFVRLEFKKRFYVYFNYVRDCHFEAAVMPPPLQPVAQLYTAGK